MKIATLNINSVRARLPNLLEFLASANPDVVGLQELKCQDEQFPYDDLKAAGYHAAIVGQKAYNGVAILSKTPANVVLNTLGDEQARYIEVDAGGIRIINIYAPNGNPLGTEKFPYKLDWLARLHARMQTLLADETSFLVMGDYNIIPDAIDARFPEQWTGDALFQPQSRAAFRAMCNLGLTDAFRVFHPEAGHYTFWDYQAGAWQRDNGIRIDHFLLSPQLADRATACAIHRDERAKEKASDHVPVMLTLRD